MFLGLNIKQSVLRTYNERFSTHPKILSLSTRVSTFIYVPMGKLVEILNKDGTRPSVTCPHFNNNKCFSE